MSQIDDNIPESGAIYNFGEIASDELVTKIWIKNDIITKVACGDEFIVFLTESGRAFSFGKNDWGQLGIGSVKMTLTPTCIKSLKSIEKAVHVACGRCHTLISTENNTLYGFGSNTEGQLGFDNSKHSILEPTKIEGWPGDTIKQISAGGEFSAVINGNYELFMWGSNSEGQLCINNSDEDCVCYPTKVECFPSPITYISCGTYHVGAISDKQLYIWGENSDHKLGLGGIGGSNQRIPKKVPIKYPVTQVACGSNHTVCLTESGDVYVWGNGDSGELGLGLHDNHSEVPKLLTVPSQIFQSFGDKASMMQKFVNVSAGTNHTAIVNCAGMLLTFGDGRHGKLGNIGGATNYSNRMWPLPAEKIMTSVWVDDVVCGGCHTVVRVRLRTNKEQINGFNVNNLSLNPLSNSQSLYPELSNSSFRARRNRRNKMDTESDTLESTLPELKYSVFSGSQINNTGKNLSNDDISAVTVGGLQSGVPESHLTEVLVEKEERIPSKEFKYTEESFDSKVNREEQRTFGTRGKRKRDRIKETSPEIHAIGDESMEIDTAENKDTVNKSVPTNPEVTQVGCLANCGRTQTLDSSGKRFTSADMKNNNKFESEDQQTKSSKTCVII